VTGNAGSNTSISETILHADKRYLPTSTAQCGYQGIMMVMAFVIIMISTFGKYLFSAELDRMPGNTHINMPLAQ
jgi:hypothetical protein